MFTIVTETVPTISMEVANIPVWVAQNANNSYETTNKCPNRPSKILPTTRTNSLYSIFITLRLWEILLSHFQPTVYYTEA